MLHHARTRLLVVAVAALLVLLPALAAQAVAEQPHAPSARSWLDGWLTGNLERVFGFGRASADDEAVPSLDPDDPDESLDSAVQMTDSEAGGETAPSLDPDG